MTDNGYLHHQRYRAASSFPSCTAAPGVFSITTVARRIRRQAAVFRAHHSLSWLVLDFRVRIPKDCVFGAYRPAPQAAGDDHSARARYERAEILATFSTEHLLISRDEVALQLVPSVCVARPRRRDPNRRAGYRRRGPAHYGPPCTSAGRCQVTRLRVPREYVYARSWYDVVNTGHRRSHCQGERGADCRVRRKADRSQLTEVKRCTRTTSIVARIFPTRCAYPTKTRLERWSRSIA